MRLAATLGYSQATNDSIVLREVSPLVMRQKVPNLVERKKRKKIDKIRGLGEKLALGCQRG
jgi:hypothetical protein